MVFDLLTPQMVLDQATAAYLREREWREGRKNRNGGKHSKSPTPTAGAIIDSALGIEGMGTPEQERQWAAIADRVIDIAEGKWTKPIRQRPKCHRKRV